MYKSKIQDPRQVRLPPADISLSLSPMRYTKVSVCSNEEHISSIYSIYSFCHLILNLTSQTHLTKWADFT